MTIRKNREPEPVDWGLVKQRLASAGAALESGFSPGAAQRKMILQERARALAVDHVATDPGPEIDVLEFLIGGEGYALEMHHVQEVHALNELTPLPCTPDFVRGIVNLHGRILSVTDLLPLFGLPQKPLRASDKLIVLREGSMSFGVLIDEICGVRRLPLRTLQALPATATGIPSGWAGGVTPERHVLLDAKALLTDKTVVVDQETLA